MRVFPASRPRTLLSRRHRVSLFERSSRLGGHTHTVVVDSASGPVPLDTGFLVHNDRTYPNLVRLFTELGVETKESDMSFSVSCPRSGIEYSSRGIGGFFAQPRNIARPGHYRLLREILRFNREAPRVLTTPAAASWTLGDYLAEDGYSDEFVARYLAPMASAIWSSSLDSIHRFPAQTLVRFMQNHGMLSVGAHPTWRVVRGGSHTYIPKLVAPLRAGVHTDAEIVSVRRCASGGVAIAFAIGLRNASTMSCSPATAIRCCRSSWMPPTWSARFSTHFTTTTNDVWLHTDDRVLPATLRGPRVLELSPWLRRRRSTISDLRPHSPAGDRRRDDLLRDA